MRKPQIDVVFLIKGAESVSDEELEDVLEQADAIKAKAKKIFSLRLHVTLLLRMLRDYFIGAYTSIPYRIIAGAVFCLLYLLLLVDGIPDVLPGIGLTDDALLVALLFAWAREDIEEYRAWREQNREEPSDTP